ncbi:MAG: aldo/keto reductase [Clostridiales bacterium]|nr:aldo/keto reductase [Clostridiales bacterium]
MEYRINPNNGDKLSALGFGCMRFTRGLNLKVDVAKAEPLVLSAIEGGVNYFDTAYIYFGSEEALGEILHRNDVRDKIFLATKLPYQQCKGYEDFGRLFQTQLERLKTTYFDYYLIHNISDLSAWDVLRGLGIERWIEEQKAEGRIRQIGFSFHGPQNSFFDLLDAYPWDFCQIQYNYLNEHYQAGRAGLQRAGEKGIPVVVMEPLLGGKLAAGLPKKAARLFRDADSGRSPAAWALRWLWDQPEVTVVLSGMNAAPQLEDNLLAAGSAAPGVVTEAEAAVYAAVKSVYQETDKLPCTGCNYCMPCPNQVNIPGCFAAYNTSYAAGYGAGIQQYITGTGANRPDKGHTGRKCVKCGACEERCPQRIGIMAALETVTRRMEPPGFGAVMSLVSKFT